MMAYNLKNADNVWKKKLDGLKKGTEDSDQVASLFVEKLKEDLDKGQASDCALHAPRVKGHYDKLTNIGHKIAFQLFPMDEKEALIRAKKQSYTRYSQAVSKLSKQFKEKLEQEEKERLERKKAPFCVRRNFCTLKKKPTTEAVNEPTPMPVDVAPLEELQPFFDFMKENKPVSDDMKQFTRGTMFKDGRLDMCKQVVGSPFISNLMDSIKDNEHVEHFLMGNNITNLSGAKSISDFIKDTHKSKIETWYLAGNEISSEGIALIAKALETDTDCKSLWLKRNPLKPEGIRHLADMLRMNNTIEILDLHNTGVFNEGCDYLFDALKENDSLQTLYLDANGITDVSAICDYFDYCVKNNKRGVVNLWLSINRLEDDGVTKLGKSLKDYHHLERICVASNRIENDGIKSFLNDIKHLPNLIMLNMGWYKSTFDMGELPNNVSDIEPLCDFIATNKSCKVLCFSNNHFDADSIIKLSKVYENNHNILSVGYDQFGVEVPQETVQRLNKTMERNIKDTMGIERQDFISNHLRRLKHTDKVVHIDSIYRNRM